MALRRYNAGDVDLMLQRYKVATGGGQRQFMRWMGFTEYYIDSVGEGRTDYFTNYSVATESEAHKKSELLLNDNWYALMKILEAQQDG
jgi:hypothetical protein